jgi:hypothetical protein
LTSDYPCAIIRYVTSLVNSNTLSTIQDSELPLSKGTSRPKLFRIRTYKKVGGRVRLLAAEVGAIGAGNQSVS